LVIVYFSTACINKSLTTPCNFICFILNLIIITITIEPKKIQTLNQCNGFVSFSNLVWNDIEYLRWNSISSKQKLFITNCYSTGLPHILSLMQEYYNSRSQQGWLASLPWTLSLYPPNILTLNYTQNFCPFGSINFIQKLK